MGVLCRPGSARLLTPPHTYCQFEMGSVGLCILQIKCYSPCDQAMSCGHMIGA